MRPFPIRSPTASAGRAASALAVALGGLVAPPPAGAQEPTPAITLEDDSGYSGQLAVDAHGGSVVAWRDRTRRGNSIVARVRPPSGAFGPGRRLATRDVIAFRLTVGPRGDAAVVVIQPAMRGPSRELVVARSRPAGRFGRPVALGSSPSASEPAAAIDSRGTLLVAWLQSSGRKSCGHVVIARVAPAGGRFGSARRVSAACANAAHMSVALARSGAGAITWRSTPAPLAAQPRHHLQISTYTRRRFAPPRTVPTGPVWFGRPALAAGGGRALVAWRDHGQTTLAGDTRGQAHAVTIDGARIGRPVAVSEDYRIQGDVYAAMNGTDAAIVSWVQTTRGDTGSRVAIRPAPGAPFAAPEAIAACAQGRTLDGSGRDHLDSAARVALDAAGRALAIFGENCAGGLGGARRTTAALWQPPFAVGTSAPGEQARPMSVGVSDAGEGVALWSHPQRVPESFDGAVLRAAVLPAPAGG